MGASSNQQRRGGKVVVKRRERERWGGNPPSPDQSLGGTVPEQSGGERFQPKHAVLHHTETQCLRDLILEKRCSEGCLLRQEWTNSRTRTRGWGRYKEIFLLEKDLLTHIKKDKDKKKDDKESE